MKSRHFLKNRNFLIVATLDPSRSTDSESSIFDTCRSTDSGFILFGPGRARAQNSSESQKFGVIKKLIYAKCSAQRNRLRGLNAFNFRFLPKEGSVKRSSQTNTGLPRYFTQSGQNVQIIL